MSETAPSGANTMCSEVQEGAARRQHRWFKGVAYTRGGGGPICSGVPLHSVASSSGRVVQETLNVMLRVLAAVSH